MRENLHYWDSRVLLILKRFRIVYQPGNCRFSECQTARWVQYRDQRHVISSHLSVLLWKWSQTLKASTLPQNCLLCQIRGNLSFFSLASSLLSTVFTCASLWRHLRNECAWLVKRLNTVSFTRPHQVIHFFIADWWHFVVWNSFTAFWSRKLKCEQYAGCLLTSTGRWALICWKDWRLMVLVLPPWQTNLTLFTHRQADVFFLWNKVLNFYKLRISG